MVKDQNLEGFLGIGHTRWATHGGVTELNAHPHISEGEIAVVHNGIIENYEEERERLKKLGYEFESQTDTEVIAHLIHYFIISTKTNFFIADYQSPLQYCTGTEVNS
jgi:glucosamine--fructose-6-phosphate aminotransferase (isomerizing)